MKKQKEKTQKSTRELMGIDEITDYSIKTTYGELVYFIIHPTISGLCGKAVSVQESMH